jgi:hypothetical protein
MHRMRLITALAIALLLASLIVVTSLPTSGATLTGTLTGWTGNAMQGAAYTELTLGQPTTVTRVQIAFVSSGSSATLYCAVDATSPHYPPQVQNQYAWIAKWGFDMTHAQGTTTVGLSCTTTALLIAVLDAPSAALSVPGIATTTTVPATATNTGIATTETSAGIAPAKRTAKPPTATNTAIPATQTPIPATNTAVAPTTTSAAGDAGNTCADLGDGAVDQNGVSVDVWAPGKRIACGFAGYENGDNPMPAGTHLPPPRPFRFDSAVVHHESPFGFKVYYRTGAEAPAGYQGTGGCGDVRVILHQGGSVAGFTTQFHTYQFALDRCDTQGNHHVIDVAGRIDTGTLYLRSLPDSGRPSGPNRLTADTLSCNGKTTFVCATVWYAFFNFALPGATNTGWSHMGFLIENPITLYDNANPANVHLTGNIGTTTMLRDNQWYIPAHNTASWWCLFNTVSQVNEVVSAGTAGAWQNSVDPWFSNIQTLEPSYGVDHGHPITGIQYPN